MLYIYIAQKCVSQCYQRFGVGTLQVLPYGYVVACAFYKELST